MFFFERKLIRNYVQLADYVVNRKVFFFFFERKLIRSYIQLADGVVNRKVFFVRDVFV